jgi:ABC-type nitrate/sulfonate/bicarbonate transport system permease component
MVAQRSSEWLGRAKRTRMRRTTSRSRVVWRIVVVLLSAVCWMAISTWLGRAVVPSPVDVVVALGQLARSSTLWLAVWDTISTAVVGLAIAAAIGVPLGLLIGSSRFFDASTRLTVDFLRTIPAITLVPLLSLLLGPTSTMAAALIIFAAFWPIFLQAVYAVREVDPVLKDVGLSYQIPRGVRWTRVILPSAAPFLLTGLRVSSTIAILLAIAAELIGNAPGLGREIGLAQISAQNSTAYAYVAVAAILGVAINSLLRIAEQRLLFWHPSVRAEVH